MRSAALIFGLLASVLGGAAIVFGNLETGLAVALGMGSQSDLAAKLALYLIPLVGLVGAILVPFRPRLASFFMLLSAIAWLAAGFMAGHGAILFAAVPFTFVAAGGLVALSAHRNPAPIEEPPAARRPGREIANRWPQTPVEPEGADDDLPDEVPAYAPRAPRAGIRSEPDFDIAPPRRSEPGGRPPAPRHREEPVDLEPEPPTHDEEPPEEEDYPPEEDYIDADPAPDDESSGSYEYHEETEPPDERPQEPEEPKFDQPRPRENSRQDRWSLPDPESQPAGRQAPRQRYIAERHRPAPARGEALPPRNEPRPARPVQSSYDQEPDDDFVPPRRALQPRSRDAYRDVEPYDPDGQPERGPLRGLLRILVLLLFIIVVVGIAVAVYLDYGRGSQSILFGNREQATARVTSPKPAPESSSPDSVDLSSAGTDAVDQDGTAAMPADQDSASSAAEPADEDSALPPSAPSEAIAPPASTPAPATPVPLARPVASAPPAGMADPFAYCRAVNTIDAPDSRYTGPAVPPLIASALSLTGSTPTDQVHWRCGGQMVLACNAKHSAACDLTPTVDLMVSYCAQHPNTPKVPAPNGFWSCSGTRPVIPRDQKWPVDARGFYPDAWSRVVQPTG